MISLIALYCDFDQTVATFDLLSVILAECRIVVSLGRSHSVGGVYSVI